MTQAMARGGAEAPPKPDQINVPGFEIHDDDTVVDVGCGEGVVCVYAGHRGAEVIGIDLEPILIERANHAMLGVPARSFRGIVSDADPIPLPNATASVVICTEVLEHVDDPARFLAELVRIGKPGARYLLSVPDPASESVLKSVAPDWYWQKPLHIRVFQHEHLDQLCRAAGLKIEARHNCGIYWSMHWFCRMALGMEHKYEPAPEDSTLLNAWDTTFRALMAAPGGDTIRRQLDQVLPKSQVVVAHKAGGPASSFAGPAWRRSLKRVLRDGAVRLGGFDLQWKVRRSPTPPQN